ncbi:tRNA pseudouridine synthase B [Allomyces macrogynus ATCC 38327]|uniref:tRNA pseudouridine(55) synthase n=1 Tax=Allomyces macrogynus (strain ATCC 38327) TaxID=578462 RepID=A0A0L0T073_ALLM3|nr:tRNA pseudouridine synthase B [Allomyces macrogynus ATCC 38327]|eukprot:KNE68188.1 tRNA pseudouridine synthase B [Allomyces macrogynus ATCC 38327]
MSLRRALNGSFAVDKPQGKTSAHILKVGHGGTQDPLATGVLIIGVGHGTKALASYLDCTKTYTVTGQLGAETDTYDMEGQVTKTAPYDHITRDLIDQTLPRFRGDIMQVPPIFSAIKRDGMAMYDYARSGKPIPELEPRPVTISSLELMDWIPDPTPVVKSADLATAAATPDADLTDSAAMTATFKADTDARATTPSTPTGPQFQLQMTCTKGTYVRSIVHDLADAMDSAAHVVQLRRIRQGDWDEASALSYEQWDVENVLGMIKPVDPPVEVDDGRASARPKKWTNRPSRDGYGWAGSRGRYGLRNDGYGGGSSRGSRGGSRDDGYGGSARGSQYDGRGGSSRGSWYDGYGW